MDIKTSSNLHLNCLRLVYTIVLKSGSPRYGSSDLCIGFSILLSFESHQRFSYNIGSNLIVKSSKIRPTCVQACIKIGIVFLTPFSRFGVRFGTQLGPNFVNVYMYIYTYNFCSIKVHLYKLV